ncbi:MAG TPA: hypothetical protein VGX03_08300 [Candidatus Binatia bacterium]|jgi:hypothetical protein|nr:hypothetical protein [Candidatus Binatia bacterium]
MRSGERGAPAPWRPSAAVVRFVDIRGIALLFLSLSACMSPAAWRVPPPSSFPTEAAKERAQTLSSPQGAWGSFYTTIAEVYKQPMLFDGQRVRLRGIVVEVQDSTFKLADEAGHTVKIVPAEPAPVRQGLEATVAGKLTVSRLSRSPTPLIEVQEAHIMLTSAAGKVAARPAATAQPEQPRPSPPVISPAPPPPAEKDEGQIF